MSMSVSEEIQKLSSFKLVGEQSLPWLVGKIKELIEASISDQEQRRAMKRIFEARIYEWWGHHSGLRVSQESVDKLFKALDSTGAVGVTEIL